MTPRIAIAQIGMHWTTRDNVTAMLRAMDIAHANGAQLCAFSELAVTGFHREIGREATPEIVAPAVDRLRTHAAHLALGVAFGTPTFGDCGARYNSHLLVDADGSTVALVSKHGLTDPEATFFARGSGRPVGIIGGLRCSAVICREVEDLDHIAAELPCGTVDVVFVPGALRQDPQKTRMDPPAYVGNIRALALATGAHVVQTNWPNALNRPEESVEGGGSTVANATGEVLFRLPMRARGVAVFTLGEHRFDWHADG